MKKKILACLLAATTMATFVGCGSKSASSEGGEVVTIKMLSRYSSDQGADDQVVNSRIEKFMEENPNIKVEHEAIGDEATYNNMFKTAIATGDAPDVFVNYGGNQFQEYVENGIFLDLNTVYEEDKEWGEKYIPSMLDSWKFEGSEGFYGVPVACFATGIYYNEALFESNGLKAPTTIKEFEEVCAAFMAKGVTPMALGDKDNFRGTHLLANLLAKKADFKYTKSIVDGDEKWNTPDMKEVFELMSNWQKKGYLGENITTMDASAEQALFLNGDTPMHLNGSWFASQVAESEIDSNIKFMAFPYFEDKPEYKNNWHSGTSEGISLAAGNGEEKLEASKKLLKYLTHEDAYNESQAIAKGGIYPVTTMDEIEDMTPICKNILEVFVDVTDTKLEPGDYAKNPQLREETRDAIQGMFAGSSVDDTLNRIQKVADMK